MTRKLRGQHVAPERGLRRLLSDPAFAPNAAMLAGFALGGWAVVGLAVWIGAW